MYEPDVRPRLIERRFWKALEDLPVVQMQGPGQCGKATLARFACAPNYLTWGDGFPA